MNRLQNLSYKTLFTILFFSLSGIIFFLRINKPAQKVSAAWWDDSWHYRKAINITNSSGSNLTDFQVSVSIGTSQLITDGKMQSDCDDIRIIDINGNLLPYWIETSTCNTNATHIWIKINNLPSSGATPYIYYGNSSAISQSDSSILPKSCSNLNSFLGSNTYYIDPDQNKNTNPLQVYCDMTTDGGGWTLFSYTNDHSDLNFPPSMFTGYGTYNPNASSGNASIGNSLLTYIDVYDLMATNLNNAQPYVPNGNLVYINNYTGGTKKPFGCLLSFPCGIACGDVQTSGLDLRGYSTSGAQEWSSNNICSTSYTTNQWSLGYSGGDWLNSTLSGIYLEYWTGGTPSSARRSAMIKGNNDTGITHKIWVRETKATNIPYNTSIQPEETGTAPIAYWKFDEGVGTNTLDSTSNQNHGTITGATWQNEDQCIAGKCLYFDGTNNYVTIPNSKSVQIINNQTISMWLKPTTFDARRNPINKAYGGEFTITLETNGTMRYYWGTAGSNNSPYQGFISNNITLNEWNHITLVRDITNNQLIWYINGKKTNQTTPSYPQATASTANITIGTGYAGSFIGYIDEVKIYSYARTANQIKQDYNSRGSLTDSSVNLGIKSNTAPNIKDSLIANYKFDEGTGITVYDSSPNKKTGTLIGNTLPTWSNNCKSKNCINFTSTNSTKITTNAIYNNSSEYTISAYIYPISTGDAGHFRIIMGSNRGNNIDSGIVFPPGESPNICYHNFSGTGDANYCSTNNPVILNQWQHVALTFKNNEVNLFHNGINVKNINVGKTNSDSYTIIGGATTDNYNGSRFFNGLIDEVKIYNRALTNEEVKQDYNQGSAIQFGSTNQTIGDTITSLEYCIPGDISYCAPPVTEWKMDEGVGISIIDTSSNNNTGIFGTGNSAPTWTQGKIGKSTKFDGINDYISIPTFTYTTNATITAWVKGSYLNGSQIIIGSPNSISLGIYNAGSNQGVIGFSGTSKAVGIANNFINDSWNHLTVTLDNSGNASYYCNGQLLTNSGNNHWTWSNGSYIGRRDSGTYFKGQIDHIKIYNYARTPAQIAYDYNKGGPIGWWKFDECQGNVAYDWSGIGNTGTINIGPSGSQNSLGTCTIGTSAAWTNGATGKINSSLNLDGTDDYIQIPNIISENDTHTISFWAKPQKNTIVWIDMSGDNGYSFIETTTNNLFIGYSPTTSSQHRTYNFPFSYNNWYHITIVKNGTGNNLNAYINGKLLPTYSGSVGNMNSGSIMYIGKFHNSGYSVQGQIDDVRIYNYPLTAEQVKQVYNDGAVSFK